jgi:hypothetical protein
MSTSGKRPVSSPWLDVAAVASLVFVLAFPLVFLMPYRGLTFAVCFLLGLLFVIGAISFFVQHIEKRSDATTKRETRRVGIIQFRILAGTYCALFIFAFALLFTAFAPAVLILAPIWITVTLAFLGGSLRADKILGIFLFFFAFIFLGFALMPFTNPDPFYIHLRGAGVVLVYVGVRSCVVCKRVSPAIFKGVARRAVTTRAE